MVALQGCRVCQDEMGYQDRLGAPQVRVGGHQGQSSGRRLMGQHGDQRGERRLQLGDPPPEIQPQVERHLVIARPPGV